LKSISKFKEGKLKKEKHLLFVYGTLKRGFWNHYLLDREEFIGEAETKEKYAMYVSGIPYVVKGEPVSRIKGEVYRVSSETLKLIDRLEGHPNWYRRELITVKVLDRGKEREVKAFIYFSLRSEGRLEKDGLFK
jgi:gamma-glutamylcyclotransferase (GGCT)/AIG2-like uncharacterized protein YtfP